MSRDDRWRPRIHFTARANWINDPNGLLWHDGEYHLFYQHNPFGNRWGHMSWGHAVGTDLLHWRELPVAIAEDERASIFSGSVVFDAHNSSGLGSAAAPPLVALYTGCLRRPEGGQAQEIAHSSDRGRSWTKYPANPVLDLGLRDFRDPKVFWHAPSARWVMAVVLPDAHQVLLFGSTDLKAWHELSRFGPAGEAEGIWECPDLFPIPVDGEPDAGRWLLKVDSFSGHPGGTGAQYFVGYFDGTRFIADTPADAPPLWADHGSDFYAALSWNGLPAQQHERPVWIGWMNNHRYAAKLPTEPWRGAMSLPRELSLWRSAQGLRLRQRPLPALANLRGTAQQVGGFELADAQRDLPGCGPAFEIAMSIESISGGEAGIAVRVGRDGESTRIGYDRSRGSVFVDRSRSGFIPADDAQFAARREVAAPLPGPGRPLALQIVVDTSSVEVFVNGGEAALTEQVFPGTGSDGIQVFARGGGAALGPLTLTPLRVQSVKP